MPQTPGVLAGFSHSLVPPPPAQSPEIADIPPPPLPPVSGGGNSGNSGNGEGEGEDEKARRTRHRNTESASERPGRTRRHKHREHRGDEALKQGSKTLRVHGKSVAGDEEEAAAVSGGRARSVSEVAEGTVVEEQDVPSEGVSEAP